MLRNIIEHKKRNLNIHKSTSPNIDMPPVLVTDTWDYVDLYLKRENKGKARFFWKQARSFYNASLLLPKESAPLTAYYCFLNAVKALLESKSIKYQPHHGISGMSLSDSKTTLENEKIFFNDKGVAPEFLRYLGYKVRNYKDKKFSLLDCFYNVPYLHRAFLLTYQSKANFPELYISIKNPYLIKHANKRKAWFSAELEQNYDDKHTINKLPKGFEKDYSYTDFVVIRDKRRTKWLRSSKEYKQLFIEYNKKIRKQVFYIHGSPTSWYLKRDNIGNNPHYLDYPPLLLTLVAMHRLSELARYTPDKLVKHFENKQNWLISEFIKVSPLQFIDEISSEITGLEFKVPKNAI